MDALDPELRLGIVGAGVMGRGIAQIAAVSGCRVKLHDSVAGVARDARAAILATRDGLVAKGRLDADAARSAASRLNPVDSLHDLADCDVVIEAIVEDLDAKGRLFREIETIVSPQTVLATNTSSLLVTEVASTCGRPDRVAGLHFFNPVPVMKAVEVIEGMLTEHGIGDELARLVRRFGHRPFRVANSPGFLVNHAGRAYVTEAARVAQDGIASFETIDRILKGAAGFRMGPFELLDLTGIDVSYPATRSIYEQHNHEPRLRPTPDLRRRLAAGLLGRKSGRGFYAYGEGARGNEGSPPPGDAGSCPVWLWSERPEDARRLAGLADRAGWDIDTGHRPHRSSLCLLAPLGHDATTAALQAGADPQRAVAIDMLAGFDRHRTVMRTPVTSDAALASALLLLSSDGTSCSCIADSHGFVVQRVLASIVNLACDIAQQRIAPPDEIDEAVALALGYPSGPLIWGDQLGPAVILRILERLHAGTGDPRYRPSVWLARRARLGASLRTPEL